MKGHKYQMTVVENFMSAIPGEGSRQNKLYIPNKGILCYGFYKKDEIDCFIDDKESMKSAKNIIKGESLGKNDLGPPS